MKEARKSNPKNATAATAPYTNLYLRIISFTPYFLFTAQKGSSDNTQKTAHQILLAF